MFEVIAEARRKASRKPRTEWAPPETGWARMLLVMGPPGVGKTTLVDSLSMSCPRPNARIDSDSLGCTRPGGTDRTRLDLVENNLFHCMNGFRDWGAEYIFCSWITERQHRLDGLIARLRAANIMTRAIALEAPCDELVSRMHGREDTRFEANQAGMEHLQLLSNRMHRLISCKHIDTFGRTEYEVLKHVRGLVAAPEFWED